MNDNERKMMASVALDRINGLKRQLVISWATNIILIGTIIYLIISD